MQTIQTAELRCKYCDSTDVVKAGTRRLKCGIKQLYKCNGCLRKFSNLNRNAKQTNPEVILKTLILVCRGYSYEQASRFVLRKYQTLISTSIISKWVKEYNPPYYRRMLNPNVPQASRLPSGHKTSGNKAGGTPAIHTCYPPFDTCHSELCSVAGHIDLLQYKFNTLYILDFSRNAVETANPQGWSDQRERQPERRERAETQGRHPAQPLRTGTGQTRQPLPLRNPLRMVR